MKKLTDLTLTNWFMIKQSNAFINACINPKYTYEVINETEKAIQIRIEKPDKIELPKEVAYINEWKMWIPKSAIIGNF